MYSSYVMETARETKKSVLDPVGANLMSRPPIVVIMGHVDHGKTTLLDYIRKANIAAREAGGITQAVGAYEILHIPAGGAGNEARKITFIDTPGHEAFAAMRSRGAQAADLAVLVVAADEGMRPQTKEAVRILEETKTPFIVAFTKTDKPGANVEKVKTELLTAGVLLEGFGGQISHQGVSSKSGEGIDELLDLILLAADLEGLTYDPAAPASGYVLEARRDPRRGVEVAIIIKDGTLRRGDALHTPTANGKVKILENFLGKTEAELEPCAPALIVGFESLPKVGEVFQVGACKEASGEKTSGRQISKGPAKAGNSLNLILKATDAGSLEVLSLVLRSEDARSTGKELRMVDESVGDITDGDVKHAIATNSTIIGFKSHVEKGAKNLAEGQSVAIITSDVVYDLSKAVGEFLSGVRGPASIGELSVLAVFNQEKLEKQLVGGAVTMGTVRGKTTFELFRVPAEGGSRESIGTGKVFTLRDKKTEIAQAEKGKEIGVLVSSETKINIGDILVIRK
jgi:translation initiation factor IF-2